MYWGTRTQTANALKIFSRGFHTLSVLPESRYLLLKRETCHLTRENKVPLE